MKRRDDTLKRILGFVAPYRTAFILVLVFSVLSVAGTLYVPILTGDAIDFILGPGNVNFPRIVPILIQLLVTIAVGALAQYLLGLCTNRLSYGVARDIRLRAMDKLEDVPLKTIDTHSHGDLLSRVITDVNQVSEGLLMGFTQLFSGVITIFGTLGFMYSVDARIATVVVVVTPLPLLVANFIARRTFSMFKLQSATRGELTALVEEMVGNQKVVKAFGHEGENEAAFDKINERLRSQSLRATFFSSITNPSTRFVNGVVYALVCLFGALMALDGGLSVGALSCFLTYANQYTKPFNEISGVVAELQSAMASARRVFEVIDFEEQAPDASDAVELESVRGDVEIDNVNFSYREDAPLIENLNLRARPGQRVAIVGPTGCGKTTIINLLMRFYDVRSGEIRVDGHPVMDVTRDSLRGSYGMVLQETWLRSGTIRENIAYGRPDASEEEIVAAAREAHAHSFIMRLPEGYDTVISEDGGNISQGQRQLLCIARVMLTHPPMLILDEATSSIDTRTEQRIQRAFAQLMTGRTSFIVAHRLSTIREADQILVMRAGHIIEQGRHEELLQKGGFYAELYNSQFAVEEA